MVKAEDIRWAELKARNLNLPGIDPSKPGPLQAQRKPQQPCDIGLFSETPRQLDLVDYIRAKR